MENQTTTIAQDIEQLIKKVSHNNTIIISDTVNFLQQLSTSNLSRGDVVNMQKELFNEAVNLFVKINIQHVSNLFDMGVAISKHLNQQLPKKPNDFPQPTPFPVDDKPAFELNIACSAGNTAAASFLLNSDKKDPVTCDLKQTSFILETDPSEQSVFNTTFLPQSCQLVFGKPQRVEIKVEVPSDTKPGVYRSHINVSGFEHTYFDLLLNVTAPQEATIRQRPAKKSATIPPPDAKKTARKSPAKPQKTKTK